MRAIFGRLVDADEREKIISPRVICGGHLRVYEGRKRD